MRKLWKDIEAVKVRFVNWLAKAWDWILILIFCLIVPILILLYLLPAPSIGIQIIVESSQIELDEVLPAWSVNSKADTNVNLQAFKYVAISRLDSLDGAKISADTEDTAAEQARIYAKKPTGSDTASCFVRLENLVLDGPAHITLQQGSNYIKLLMKDGNEKPSHNPLRIYATFDAPNGHLMQPPDNDHQPPIIRPVEVIFNSLGADETEWTFSGKPIKDSNYLNFNWMDIPVIGGISFREFGKDRSSTGHSTIRSGTIRLLETNEEIKLNARDFLDITLNESEPVSVDITSRNKALVSTITGRVVGLKKGRDAHPINLMPNWIKVLANESRVVPLLTAISALATLIVSIAGLKRK